MIICGQLEKLPVYFGVTILPATAQAAAVLGDAR